MRGVLTERGYGRLLADVGGLIAAGRAEAEALAGHALATTYWKVGTRIEREGLSTRAGYGEGVLAQLADALGVSHATLGRAVRFARLYGAAPEPGLSWAHYQELIAVADPDARAFYQARALEAGWTKRKLRAAIAERVFVTGEADGGDGRKVLPRPDDASYLYRCDVVQVIDGDTLLAHVDLGFEVIKAQRVRLSGVDAAEAKTAAGKRATQWLRERLATAERVVMRTDRASDLHGRYVAHVFYSGDAEASAEQVFREGTYLNAELAARGHAEVV